MIKSVDWLLQNMHRKEVIILDASLPAKKERSELIPGSRFFDLKKDFSDPESPYPNMMPSVEKFQSEARKLGISSDSIIIVYDNVGIYSAPRAWYMFRSMGHSETFVLDGGLPEWISAGYSVETPEEKAYPSGNFKAEFDPEAFKRFEDVEQNVFTRECLLIDARSEGRFWGREPEPRVEIQSGYIDGAMSLPFTEVLENGKFKSKKELKRLFKEDKPIIFSCGSGITACILLLAAEIAEVNVPVSIFDGSWTEWAMRKDLYVK